MSTLAILSLLFTTAAIFGLISSRWLRLPITIGTMLLTVITSAALMIASQRAPGIHKWAADLVQQIDFGPLPALLPPLASLQRDGVPVRFQLPNFAHVTWNPSNCSFVSMIHFWTERIRWIKHHINRPVPFRSATPAIPFKPNIYTAFFVVSA